MEVNLNLERNMRLIGKNKQGLEVIFDTDPSVGGENTAPKPMETFLMALGACTSMDVLSILRKKRKTIQGFSVKLIGERAREHPMVFTKVHLVYELVSPDATIDDLNRSIELSQTKYCSASAMFKEAGCEVSWEAIIKNDENA